jgi:hypothetical protein
MWDTPLEIVGCPMVGFGCLANHALKDCIKFKAAVWKHPAFDLKADTQLNSFIGCERCECTRGDGYIWDDDGEKVIEVDTEFKVCGHCTGSCWCEQRYWVGGEGYFDFDRGVEVSVFERKNKICDVCDGKGRLFDN